jgi:hypothetical protein
MNFAIEGMRMAKRKLPTDGQLSLDLSTKPKVSVRDARTASRTVVSFVDATVLKVRREAVNRVRSAGIFTLQGPAKR